MTDIEKAKEILINKNKTCVLVKKDAVYTSEKSGIAPMLGFLGDGTDLEGFSAADKIIGKAAALLFIKAGVSEVYGEVMSNAAIAVLADNEVKYSYKTLTDVIINRKGDGICPMEATVENISDPAVAEKALREKLALLKSGVNGTRA